MFNVKNTTELNYKGARNTHDADVHRAIVNRQFHRETATASTLLNAVAKGSYIFDLVNATNFQIGNYIHIQNGTIELVHPQIKNKVGNTITIDRPLDNDYQAGNQVNVSTLSMNVNATIGTPVSYKVEAYPGEVIHCKKITLSMWHSSAGDFGTFGNIDLGLQNGVVLRRYDGLTQKFDSFTIWKNNGDIDLDTGTVDFPTRSSGGGTYGTSAIGRFDDAGSIVYLNGNNGDYIELLIQDNLSTLLSFVAKIQGHYEGV